MDSDSRSPVKTKKPKSFKFLHKKEKEEKEEKRKGRREEKKKEREKEKEEKLRAKEEKKRNKKDKKKLAEPYTEDGACVVFGVPLSVAVERSPIHDGVKLPLVVRQCIDYIQEHGLECEGIYRLSGVKSKVQQLRRSYNSATAVCLKGSDPHVVASLLKQFLRELPEPVLTADMTAHFEDASQIPGWRDRAEAIRQLLHRLPTPNSSLVHYILAHMGHIIDKEIDTKMNYQNVCIVLSPTMRISHRVLNVFFQNHSFLFGDVIIKRYLAPVNSNADVDRILELCSLQQEVVKLEAVLVYLHRLLAASPHNTIVEERLWEAQRLLTYLKRKVKLCQREELQGAGEEGSSEESQRESVSDATNNSTSLLTTASDSVAATEDPIQSREIKNNKHSPQGAVAIDKNEQQKQPTKRSVSQEIPKLPKPVSARGERTKLGQHKSAEMFAATNQKHIEAVESAGTVTISAPSQEAAVELSATNNQCVPFSHKDHVTVINISVANAVIADAVANVASNSDEVHAINTVNSNEGIESRVSAGAPVAVTTGVSLGSAANIQNNQHFGSQYKPLFVSGVDAELVSLVREEAQHLAHHAELLAMNHDLSRKLHAEKAEITRLKDEIQELQTLYGYRTYSYDSSESGGESGSGGAMNGESDTEEEDILQQLHQHNTQLQLNNNELVQRIQEEREAVVLLKARLRQTQASSQQQMPPSFSAASSVAVAQ